MTTQWASPAAHLDATAQLLAGPLGRVGGVQVVDGLLDRSTRRALTREALSAGRAASRQVGATQAVDDHAVGATGRNDVAGRALGSGSGGPALDAWYNSPRLRATVSELCGVSVRPTGNRGSYSYYTRPGDHLDLHVDVNQCDVTVIAVLQDSTPPDHPGGALATWGGHLGRPLDEVRASQAQPTATLKAPVGSTIVILGGLLPHAVLPLGSSGSRVISPLCFAARP